MSALLSAWVAEMVLIAYRGSKSGSTANNPIPHLSLPSEYASTFIIFGALSFIPDAGQRFAAAFGWGLVIATALNVFTPPGSNASGPVTQKTPIAGATSTMATPGALQTPKPGTKTTPFAPSPGRA